MKRIIPIIILLAVAGSGLYWWYNYYPAAARPATTTLVGSGNIEAETVAITAEIGGRVTGLQVGEGDEVTAGQVLVELDKATLLAQQTQLEAALITAETNLASVIAPIRKEEAAAAWAQLTQAEINRDGAKVTWETALRLVKQPHNLTAQINQAQANVTTAQSKVEQAQVNLKKAQIQAEAASRNQSTHAALVQNEVAQHQLAAAQVSLQMTQISLEGSQRQLNDLIRLRQNPLQLEAQANAAEAAYQQASAAVLAAQANLTAVTSGATLEDINVAQAQVQEAQAALAAVQVKLDKMTLTAPRDGLISKKLVNPGELAAAGTVLLELSDINEVDLTIFIPETRIGEVKIGQTARVYPDAYNNETFEGKVSFIAHEAEFTPRNVQTQEERVQLVYAVKIKLANPDHHLKPGMPADAEIIKD